MKPVNNNVVILWEKEQESVTSFGLVLPDSKKRGDTATVVAVHSKSQLSVGDVVIFDKLKGRFYEEDGKELLIINEEDIFGVVEEE